MYFLRIDCCTWLTVRVAGGDAVILCMRFTPPPSTRAGTVTASFDDSAWDILHLMSGSDCLTLASAWYVEDMENELSVFRLRTVENWSITFLLSSFP